MIRYESPVSLPVEDPSTERERRLVIPRVSVSAEAAKTNVHKQNVAEINGAVERWYFEKGKYPKANLSDIGADANYFPDGIPKNPLTNKAYRLNAKNRVQ